MEKITTKQIEMQLAIDEIAPWLSASLSPMNGGSHVACEKYEKAVNAILELATLTQLEDTIEDGFGGSWSAICAECEQRSMQIVRPGKVQCASCG